MKLPAEISHGVAAGRKHQGRGAVSQQVAKFAELAVSSGRLGCSFGQQPGDRIEVVQRQVRC
jgi:hypothetical protein